MITVNPDWYKIKGYVEASDPSELVCYSVGSPWWCLLKDNPHRTELSIPSDPKGNVLWQAPLGEFLTAAKSNPMFYGRHGMNAFWSAYDKMLLEGTDSVVLAAWDDYNNILDTEAFFHE